ncbi:hypothetical protein B296_00018793 [Ensete ventricosum]|uniref:Protein kinase domain-containing protein n=1 Tax=Ensete ventricosum TaxID=4639 RepID=A0A426Z328_ENSVE|nr:hypothetical protein B296_00018793 [Ensete ventricosum]
MKIAAGAAKGLEYLHDKANPPVIYRDFKSSNILLSEGYNPKLSDFGLAKLGPVGDKTHVSTRVMGTYGYCAPEYAMTGQLTVKSDVYSFGVVFLELITGRKAIDNTRPAGEQNLVAWEQAATRPLIGDVVTALSYLASQTYDQNAATAQNTRVGPSTPRSRSGFDNQQAVHSPHRNSPDLRQRDLVKGVSKGAKHGRGGSGGGSGRKWGLDELETQLSQMDSPVHVVRARDSPKNI